MKTFLFLSFALLALVQKKCGQPTGPAIPACIQARIDSIKQQPRWNPPAEVTEYRYNGKTVFLFSSPCCDRFNEMVDENCQYFCAPSGGYTGKGDNRCPDFSERAEKVRVVWKDERERE